MILYNQYYEKVSVSDLPYKQRKILHYSFLGLVFWLTLRDKDSSNIETFLDKDKAIERAEDYLRYLKRKNSRVLKVTGRIDITSRLKSVREDGEG